MFISMSVSAMARSRKMHQIRPGCLRVIREKKFDQDGEPLQAVVTLISICGAMGSGAGQGT